MNDGYGCVQKFGIKQRVWLCQQENDDKPRDFNRYDPWNFGWKSSYTNPLSLVFVFSDLIFWFWRRPKLGVTGWMFKYCKGLPIVECSSVLDVPHAIHGFSVTQSGALWNWCFGKALYVDSWGAWENSHLFMGDNRCLWHCRSRIRFFLGPKSSSTAFPCCCKSFQDAQCQAASPDALNRSVFFGGLKRKVLMWLHMGMFISPCKSWGIRWLVIREACKSWLFMMLDDGSFPWLKLGPVHLHNFAWPKIGFWNVGVGQIRKSPMFWAEHSLPGQQADPQPFGSNDINMFQGCNFRGVFISKLSLIHNQALKLVGGLESWNFLTFHSVGNENPNWRTHFFRGYTTNQRWYIPLYPIKSIVFDG